MKRPGTAPFWQLLDAQAAHQGYGPRRTPAVSACQTPVLRSEIPHIPGLDSIKHLPADYGGTAPAMMWRNGRFLPGNGGAALL